MKKILAMLMAVAMAVGMTATAFAADDVTVTYKLDDTTVTESTLLTPGETYEIDVNVTGVDVDLENTHQFRISYTKGASAVDSMKFEQANDGSLTLVVTTKAGWPTAQTSVDAKIDLRTKSGNKLVKSTEISYKVGYAKFAMPTGLEKGDYVDVDPATPVITKDVFEKLAKLNDYKAVTFANADWRFEVKVTDQADTNMVSNANPVKDILTKYENQEFKFVTFPAGPKFGAKGTVTIDMSAEEDDFAGKYFVYRYLDGKLYSITSTYDAGNAELSFSTDTLGRFVITNKQITDTTVVAGSDTGTSKNPNTGSNDMVSVAATLAVVSLLAAGVVVLKKSK